MKIAIQGAGIAGPTLAYWLHQNGHEPTLIEKASQLRVGGYMIDFWGTGYDVAERMGLLPTLQEVGYLVNDLRFEDGNRKPVVTVPVGAFRHLAKDRLVSLPRGDLASSIFRLIENEVETLFDNSVTSLEQHDHGVTVQLEQGGGREFDLVIGADGVHSQIRELAFGPDAEFESQLGFWVAAFRLYDYQPRNELTLVGHTQPGRQILRFSKRDGSTLVFMTFLDEALTTPPPTNLAERKASVRQVLQGVRWECPQIVQALDDVDEVYFDRVSQIKMEHWSRGRVALLGDAAACASLLAGEGSGLAMTEAYVLAGELQQANGDYATAFQAYEAKLSQFVADKQTAALRLASSFAPKSRFSIWLRDMGLRLLHIPPIARYLIGPSLSDDFELPDYPPSRR